MAPSKKKSKNSDEQASSSHAKEVTKAKIRDYKNFIVDPVDIAFGANIILENTKLNVQYGEHYGLIGKNGIGKTSLLNAIMDKTLDIPEKLDIIYVKQEEAESDETVLNALLKADPVFYEKVQRLNELEELVSDETVSDAIVDEFNKLSEEVGSEGRKTEIRAQKILLGLGFNSMEQQKKIKEFSGGWRMRVSLAKALFMVPSLLILDEPTNHLDLHANLWLTSYLKTYPKTLILVSHDQYFIDEVCTVIMHIHNKKLIYHKGNYDQFQKQLQAELDKNQKDWKLVEKKVDEMKKENKTMKDVNAFLKEKGVTRPEKKNESKD